MKLSLNLNAASYQLMLQDVTLDISDDEIGTNWWTEEDQERMLSVKFDERLVVIGTFRDAVVPVYVEVFGYEPVIDSDTWDQISECSLVTHTGTIFIMGNFDYLPEREKYFLGFNLVGVRIYYGGASTIDEMEISGQDYYMIHLWPIEKRIDLRTIKQRPIHDL